MSKKLKRILSLSLICGLFLVGCSTADVKNESNQESSIIGNIEEPVKGDDISNNNSNNFNDITSSQDSDSGVNISVNTLSEMKVTFISTGNSDSILIQAENANMLIDTGDNDDEKYIANYLKNKNIDTLDYLVLTHWDADHIGGADSVLKNITVKNVLIPNGDADTKTYRDYVMALSNSNANPSVPIEGSKFNLGNSYFEVYNTDGGNSKNDDSLIVKLVNKEDVFLFTGDAGKDIENKVKGKIGDVDVLKVGHHGSHSSTSKQFLKSITPEFAVILCGDDNKYGHPHKEVVDLLKEENIEVHRTDECNDIEFVSTGSGVYTHCIKGTYNPGKNSKYSKVDKVVDSVENILTSESNMSSDGKTYFWTPNGKSYHTTKECSALSRSKTILSGSLDESGKSDPCDRCN